MIVLHNPQTLTGFDSANGVKKTQRICTLRIDKGLRWYEQVGIKIQKTCFEVKCYL